MRTLLLVSDEASVRCASTGRGRFVEGRSFGFTEILSRKGGNGAAKPLKVSLSAGETRLWRSKSQWKPEKRALGGQTAVQSRGNGVLTLNRPIFGGKPGL